jgi:hypothetical protein
MPAEIGAGRLLLSSLQAALRDMRAAKLSTQDSTRSTGPPFFPPFSISQKSAIHKSVVGRHQLGRIPDNTAR